LFCDSVPLNNTNLLDGIDDGESEHVPGDHLEDHGDEGVCDTVPLNQTNLLTEEHDGVDDGEGEHVPGDHLEDHGDEGAGELDGPAEEHEVGPGAGHTEDQKGLLQYAVLILI
jgi:hypothetical protein